MLYELRSLIIVILSIFFQTNKMIVFFIIFEISLIPIILIVNGFGYQPERIQARTFLLIYTFVFRIWFFFLLRNMGYMLNLNSPQTKTISQISGIFLFLPFLVKMPVYFLHLWLPKAHLEASALGRIILAGILLKMGRYGLFVMLCQFQFWKGGLSGLAILLASTRTVRAVICLTQSDQKRIVAYYSVNHITFIGMGVFLYTGISLKYSFALIYFHGVVSSLIFLLRNDFFYFKKRRLIVFSKNVLVKRAPHVILFTSVVLLNLGIPPFIGFLVEVFILSPTLVVALTPLYLLIAMLIVTIQISIYMFRNSFYFEEIELARLEFKQRLTLITCLVVIILYLILYYIVLT